MRRENVCLCEESRVQDFTGLASLDKSPRHLALLTEKFRGSFSEVACAPPF